MEKYPSIDVRELVTKEFDGVPVSIKGHIRNVEYIELQGKFIGCIQCSDHLIPFYIKENSELIKKPKNLINILNVFDKQNINLNFKGIYTNTLGDLFKRNLELFAIKHPDEPKDLFTFKFD